MSSCSPDYYCKKCRQNQIGIGNPVNSNMINSTSKWIPDIFSNQAELTKWLDPPDKGGNNGGNIACDPNVYPAYKGSPP